MFGHTLKPQQPESTYVLTDADIERENRMTILWQQMEKTEQPVRKQQLFQEYQQLHHQRSPAFIQHMEVLKRQGRQ